jgi:tRNA A37 threonylcarbamoyladenosine biosynthesis protein TsaE
VIEWAERVEELLPEERLDVLFSIEGARKRRIELFARGERHERILGALRGELRAE